MPILPRSCIVPLLVGVLWLRPGAAAANKTHRTDAPQSRTGAAGKVFDVKQFGAKGNGTDYDTLAVQKAIDAAGAAGGGTVRVPAGSYRLQPIHLRSGVTLQLDEGATLRASDDPRDYAALNPVMGERLISFISGKHITDVAITGRGTVDGSGRRWWQNAQSVREFSGHTDLNRPRLVNFGNCQRVSVEGITLQNSPMFHLVFNNCENAAARNVTIHAPADSPNTDGIDPINCRGVTISGCRIDTGDDDVAVKSFHVDPAHPNAACANVSISGCTFLHGHGVSIGSETTGGVSNVAVQHCTFDGTRYGFRIKSARGRGGVVENVRVSDIQMHDVDPAIDIMCYYPHPPMGDVAQPMTSDTPVYRHIHIENLTATCPRDAGVIIGLPESPITDLTLTNVHISARSGLDIRDAQVARNDR